MNNISINNINYSIGSDVILKDISFDVDRNEFVVIIGPNGGGKSTLIKLMLGLYELQSGEIKFFGDCVKDCYNLIGYVPQDMDRIKNFPINVLDTSVMGFYPHLAKKYSKEEIYSKGIDALKLFGIADLKDRRLNQLSTGQRQKVYLARAIAPVPKILILDEPVSGVDPTGQKTVLEKLKELSKDMTILFVSHDLSIIPDYATSVACVNTTLHYHKGSEITTSLLTHAYGELSAMTLVKHECMCDTPHE